MTPLAGWRGFWWALLPAIIVAGLLSRVVHTGFLLFDKYLGDALYAAMVYVILRLTGRIARATLWSAVAMSAIELFQLTRIPAGMLRSASPVVRVCARLLGTEFNVLDLLAYAVGIACLAAVDRCVLVCIHRGNASTIRNCTHEEEAHSRGCSSSGVPLR